MKSLQWRLTVWFAASLLLVVGVLIVSAHWHLDWELKQEKWERTNPAHPDWILHGSFTDTEVHDILGELLDFWLAVGVPLVGAAVFCAYWLARRSTRPVREVNLQLARLGPTTLARRVAAPDADPEIRELVRHFNELLARLETSFTQLQEYTAEVAHELRTPLQLMRLKIESQAASMDPELAEVLQEELARLSKYVETALTIALAEQGRLEIQAETVALRPFLEDVLEPFGRLAESEKRRLLWSCPDGVEVRTDRDALRQILFNLLTNAMKHGTGDILFRVRERPRFVVLLVGNNASTGMPASSRGLGIGLRLVTALAGQLQNTRVRFHRGRSFWTRLELPLAGRTVSANSVAPATAAV